MEDHWSLLEPYPACSCTDYDLLYYIPAHLVRRRLISFNEACRNNLSYANIRFTATWQDSKPASISPSGNLICVKINLTSRTFAANLRFAPPQPANPKIQSYGSGKTSLEANFHRIHDNGYNNYDDDYVTLEVTTWSALLRHGTESSPRSLPFRLRIIYASGYPNAVNLMARQWPGHLYAMDVHTSLFTFPPPSSVRIVWGVMGKLEKWT